jgi:hypothetical protein
VDGAGDLGAEADALEHARRELLHELADRLVELGDLVAEFEDPAGQAVQRDLRRDRWV